MAKKLGFNLKLKTHDKFLLVSGVLSAVCLCAVIFSLKNLQPVVPLFYTLPSGDEQLMSKEYLYILPGLGILINIITLIFVNLKRDYDETILKLMTIVVLVFQILILSVTARIILLVI